MYYIFIPIMSIVNRLRGWGPTDNVVNRSFTLRALSFATSKYVCAIYVALLSLLLLGVSYIEAGIIMAGWALWAVPGWGEYFDFQRKDNDEIGWIDWLVSRLNFDAYMADTVSMALRGLYGYPLFVALSLYAGEYHGLLIGLLLLLQGPIYYISYLIRDGVKHVEMAEVIMGFLWGALLFSQFALSSKMLELFNL